MMRRKRLPIALATTFALAATLLTSLLVGTGAQADEVAENVIVQVPDGSVPELVAELDALGESPDQVYTEVLDGAAVTMTPAEQDALAASMPGVTIVPDTPVHVTDYQPSATTSPVIPGWNLDRIDQPNLPVDATYNYPTDGGANARVYVIDTGVENYVAEFGSRLVPGKDFLGEYADGRHDPFGHGTHVAGTIGSVSYGVAKKTIIVPLRALDATGSGYTSDIIAAIDWVRINNPRGTPAIISMSLGGPADALTDFAVQTAVDDGISVVVAAGNSSANACNYSPARVTEAITVAASNSIDREAGFSNYGTCVDVFAPGKDIVSLDAFSGGPVLMSGTSMATPAVAGAVALYRSANPSKTTTQVSQAIAGSATAGKIKPSTTLRLTQSPNKLLNVSSLMGITGDGLAPAPLNLTTANPTRTSIDMAWNQPASTNGSVVTDYVVQYRTLSANAWTTFPDGVSATTSATLTGLSPGVTYSVRSGSVTSYGTTFSDKTTASTLTGTGIPTPPRLLTAQAAATSVALNWQGPETTNGRTVNDYQVEYRVKNTTPWLVYAHTASTNLGQIVSALTTSTDYEFRVAADTTDGVLGEYSSVVSTTTLSGVPDAPTGLTATVKSVASVQLDWVAPASFNGSTLTAYQAQYKQSSEPDTAWVAFVGSTQSATITVTGLTAGTQYDFKVNALTNVTNSAFSSPASATTLTGITGEPLSLAGTAGVGQVSLNWSAPLEKNGGTIRDYLAQYRVSPSGVWSDFAHVTSTVPQVTVTGLDRDVAYDFQVAAVTVQGTSIWSAATTVKTLLGTPSAPRNLVSTAATVSKVSLSWTIPLLKNGADITDYTVEYRAANVGASFTPWSHPASTLTSATITGLEPNTDYEFRVTGMSNFGAGVSSEVLVKSTLSGLPSSPIDLATIPRFTAVELTWTRPSLTNGAAITDYEVQYKRHTDLSWLTYDDGVTPMTGAFVRGLERGETYDFQVAAKTMIGTGTLSPSVRVATKLGTPSVPQNFVVSSVKPKAVLLTWTRPANLNGAVLADYVVEYREAGQPNWNTFPDGVTTLTTAKVTGLTLGTTYEFRVAGLSSFGVGEYTSTIFASTLTGLPSAPQDVIVTPKLKGLVLAWDTPSDVQGALILDYIVQYRETGSSSWLTFADGVSLVNSARITGLQPGTSYDVQIAAQTKFGEGAFSAPLTVSTLTGIASAPRSVTLSSTKTSISAYWLSPLTLNGGVIRDYVVQYKLSSAGSTDWITYSELVSTATNATIRGLSSGLSYDIRVCAVTQVGNGDFSAPVTMSTKIGL